MKHLLFGCLATAVSFMSPTTFGKEIFHGLAAKARPEVEHSKPPRILIIRISATRHGELTKVPARDSNTLDLADDARQVFGSIIRRDTCAPKTILVDPDTGEVSVRCGSEGSQLHLGQ